MPIQPFNSIQISHSMPIQYKSNITFNVSSIIQFNANITFNVNSILQFNINITFNANSVRMLYPDSILPLACSSKMAAVQQTNLFSDNNLQEYNMENSLLSEKVACGNDTEINDRFESLLEVLDNTVKMLRSIADDLAPREDKSDWESLAAAFYAIFVTFHQQIREKARRPTTVKQGECGVDRQQTLGRDHLFKLKQMY